MEHKNEIKIENIENAQAFPFMNYGMVAPNAYKLGQIDGSHVWRLGLRGEAKHTGACFRFDQNYHLAPIGLPSVQIYFRLIDTDRILENFTIPDYYNALINLDHINLPLLQDFLQPIEVLIYFHGEPVTPCIQGVSPIAILV